MTNALLKFLTAALCGAGLLVTSTAYTPAGAGEVPKYVKKACRSDYFAFCSMHRVGTPELRQCMRTNGKRLSRGCVDALVTAGLTPRPKGWKPTKVAASDN